MRLNLGPLARPALVVATGLVAGTAGTFAKMKAEGVLQPQAERIWPPTEADKRKGGADPSDHPENMPPTEIVDRLEEHPATPELSDDAKAQGAAALHWSMGVGSAVAYAVLADRYPKLELGFGVPAGLALYAVTHGSGLPVAGLQPFPWRMPRAAVAWEAGSHAVYGLTVDLTLRGLRLLTRPLTG
jgi:putative membrane protein